MSTRSRLILPLALALGLAAPAPASACLPAAGHVSRTAIRGVRVGATATVPSGADAVSYCIDGGARLSFALDRQAAVVLVASTAAGDSVHRLHPGSPAPQTEAHRPLAHSGATELFRIGRGQIVYGATRGRIAFVAAADRLLLESPGKLSYWARRLGLA